MSSKFRILSLAAVVAAAAWLAAFGGRGVDAQQTQPAKPAPTATPPIEEEPEVLKVETEAVNVLVTAQDRDRRLLLNLKPEDIKVFENGKEQAITSFSRQ